MKIFLKRITKHVHTQTMDNKLKAKIKQETLNPEEIKITN